nr:hypothetical protein [uncultured Campylobacter sp.]
MEQNSNGENFKVPNFETRNSEASNFEVLNSEPPNLESLNSKAPNSDPDALNLEAEADQNSACENSAEQQNFISDDSGSLQHNPKARDYDKDPIILENYEYLYQKLLMVFSLFIGGVFAIIVNFDWKASGAANYSANDGICMILFLLFLSLFIILPELIDYRKERPTIRLKNNQIEFYEKDKIAYVEQCENLQHNMDWSFFIGNFKGKRGLLYIFMAVLLCLVFMTIDLVVARWFLSFALFQFVGNILVKFIFCLVLGKSSDRRFSLFPALRVGEPHYGHIGLFACSRYYLIPIFRNSIYFELKEYFLARHNININDVDKIYF